jgi:hypothetical protein
MDMELVSLAQVRHALALQKRLSWDPSGPTPLHVKLLLNGLVAPGVLAAKVEEAQQRRLDLAQMLIEQGYLTEGVLEHVMRWTRRGHPSGGSA